jgi:hypothetical protein
VYCAYEQREFPESEFQSDENGVTWHNVAPRHTTLGEVPGEDIPGTDEVDDRFVD